MTFFDTFLYPGDELMDRIRKAKKRRKNCKVEV